jgi:rhomboid family GlyGly-CTERM serine protease
MPLWTVLLCGLAMAIYLVPPLAGVAIYDRDAIATGEWWRLVTGNLVHLSLMHLIFDVSALLVLGTIIELRGERHWWLICCTAGTVIGLSVYLTAPEFRYYGGLSGMVTAAVVYLCLDGLHDTAGWRGLCMFVLALAALKIGIEFVSGDTLLAVAGSQPFETVPVSHLAGACTALFVFILTRGKHPGDAAPLKILALGNQEIEEAKAITPATEVAQRLKVGKILI